ncbi:ejaculatory bulb-specific protein 3-like [Anopheles maculipalpis]|uniref:ejaculatory bulb-specific protein 3-like n=1 Tax=Anopheles maculipalpis TaxID=1496333 RepID=UPI00215998B7|nr:ejaculatory bulb-specific protein 3-like [Anopheles maculipalpis]
MAHYQTLLLFVTTIVGVLIAETYVTKYDNIDLEEIFNSKRLMDNYMNCLKDVGPCTPDGRELKDNLPDALMSDCAKCSEKQRVGSDKVIKFIIANRPDDFAILEQLYDPTGEYRRKYMQSDALAEHVGHHQEDNASGDGDIETADAHATDHKAVPSSSQDHDHAEGQTDANENMN